MSDVFLKIRDSVTLHKTGDIEGKTRCKTLITSERLIDNKTGEFRLCPTCCSRSFFRSEKIEKTVNYISNPIRHITPIMKLRKNTDYARIIKEQVLHK